MLKKISGPAKFLPMNELSVKGTEAILFDLEAAGEHPGEGLPSTKPDF